MAVEIAQLNSHKKKKKGHAVDIIIIAVILILLIGAAFVFIYGFQDYSQMKEMENTWSAVVDTANIDDPDKQTVFLEYQTKPVDLNTDNSDNTGSINGSLIISGILVPPKRDDMTVVNTITEQVAQVDYLYRSINLEALREINEDVSGYIYIPNTKVDYPILKETIPNSYYYLKHDINRKVDRYGSIFELTDEERNVPEMNNAVNIIFGHNMRSGAMFAGITNYKNSSYSTNPVYIYRDEYRIEYMPFAFCTVDCHDSIYDFDAFELGSENYQKLLNWIMSKNAVSFKTEVPGANEPIIILSTCRDADSDVRQIVCLKEIRKAIVPEYYDTLQDVYQYGGNTDAVIKTEELN